MRRRRLIMILGAMALAFSGCLSPAPPDRAETEIDEVQSATSLQHVLTNHAFASHNVNATYIAQALPHLARCQATIEAALWKRIKAKRRATRRA